MSEIESLLSIYQVCLSPILVYMRASLNRWCFAGLGDLQRANKAFLLVRRSGKRRKHHAAKGVQRDQQDSQGYCQLLQGGQSQHGARCSMLRPCVSSQAKPRLALTSFLTDRTLHQASVYGACINAKYLEVEKGMCEAEFQKFKQCVTKAVRLTSTPSGHSPRGSFIDQLTCLGPMSTDRSKVVKKVEAAMNKPHCCL